jgi:hypothetical protein
MAGDRVRVEQVVLRLRVARRLAHWAHYAAKIDAFYSRSLERRPTVSDYGHVHEG